MPIEKRWISCREAGIYLSISAKKISELCLSQKIPSVKIGGARRIDLKALSAGLEKQIAEHAPKRGRR